MTRVFERIFNKLSGNTHTDTNTGDAHTDRLSGDTHTGDDHTDRLSGDTHTGDAHTDRLYTCGSLFIDA